jgi:hypothetical protein
MAPSSDARSAGELREADATTATLRGQPPRRPAEEGGMVERAFLLIVGIMVGIGGLGLTASFGLLAFIGMPLLIVGLGCISAAVAEPLPTRR